MTDTRHDDFSESRTESNQKADPIDETSVEYLDKQFEAWNNNETEKIGKIDPESTERERERIAEEKRKEELEYERIRHENDVLNRRRSEAREFRYAEYRREKNKRNVMMALVVVGIIAMIPLAMMLAPSFIVYPVPSYYHGPFTGASIYVVDGDTGFDISSQIATFDIYVTNNTADYDAYWWIGNGTSITGMNTVLGSIDEDLYYSSVVVYTDVYAPYAESWDYLLPGNNYIYVYKP